MKISLIVTIILASTLSMSAPVKDHKMETEFVHCRIRKQNKFNIWEDAPLEECTQVHSCIGGLVRPRGFRMDECLDDENYVIWRVACNNLPTNNTLYMIQYRMTAEELRFGKDERKVENFVPVKLFSILQHIYATYLCH